VRRLAAIRTALRALLRRLHSTRGERRRVTVRALARRFVFARACMSQRAVNS
jgi:hypothetical protein